MSRQGHVLCIVRRGCLTAADVAKLVANLIVLIAAGSSQPKRNCLHALHLHKKVDNGRNVSRAREA